MASAETDRRGFAEKAFTGVRDAGLVVALIGIIALLAAPIGATIFVDGAAGAGVGELGRRVAASSKPKNG